jgi:hypothetical protein
MGFPSWSVVALDVENATPRLLFGEMAGLAVHAMSPFGREPQPSALQPAFKSRVKIGRKAPVTERHRRCRWSVWLRLNFLRTNHAF